MYGNIGIEEGVNTIEIYSGFFAHEYKGHFPVELIIKLLHLVVSRNAFQFGNTWRKQEVGTAMETLCACAYATIFFAFFEHTNIVPRFKDNLLIYVRFIDNIFLVWGDNPLQTDRFALFKHYLNT